MKNLVSGTGIALCLNLLVFIPIASSAQSGNPGGRIAQKIISFKQKGSFTKETALFSITPNANKGNLNEITKSVKKYTLLDVPGVSEILKTKPAFLNFSVPVNNGSRSLKVFLYQESISPNGFSLLTSDGKNNDAGNIVHYRGAIDADSKSVAAFSFSEDGVTGLINNADGNYIIGKLLDNSGKHIIYNDKDLIAMPVFDCSTNTAIPLAPGNYLKATDQAATLTTKCVNWYWETDYDLYTAKQSNLATLNTYMQGVFNQVATLYANDGVSITLKTLYVWTTEDPYTGTSTSGYLDQFGVNRTSFDGDLATLIGTKGGGGIAWVNGLCNSQTKYKMAYCGISTSYSTVPSYSWTVECITHEQGHLLGSRHTHDCVWNGNNTKIDGCGDNAGYPSGTCANPGNPAGGGTIMSYCHLTSVGINFNLGFGPQPLALIINNVNNASCLTTCGTGCTTPGQPAAISGNASVCSTTSQTYSVTAVSGATSYTWTLPSGWTGSSTTNSITVVAGSTSGNISVTAANTCGSGTSRALAVTVLSTAAQPGTITGNTAVCAGTAQSYSITAVSGATSYTWTLPSGWSGSSTTNSINTTSGSSGGTISVKANNSCGSSSAKTLALTITASSPAQPGAISGSATVCPGAIQTYTVSAVPGASSYIWTLPSGWSGTSTSNTISVTAGSIGGNLSVKASNGCGTSIARTLAVNISGTAPAAPGAITVTGGSATVCTGDSRTYTVTSIAGLSYNWVAPTGATITNGQGTNSIALLFTASFISPGNVSVTATNSCGTSSATSLSIAKAVLTKPGAITVTGGSAKVCVGDIRTYNVPAVAGMTYTWTAPAGGSITSGQGSASISITYTANFIANGTLRVTSNNNCGTSAARTLTIVRNVPAAPGAISGPATICTGSVGTYSVAPVSGATEYNWTIPAGGVVQGAANGSTINILWTGTRGGNLAVVSKNSCTTSGTRSLKIVISCSSGIAQINGANDNITLVYPNPTNDIANVRFSSHENAMYTFTLTDITGRKLLTEKQQAFAGINIHKFSLGGFTKGTYLVSIESNNTKQVLKINVQ